MSRKKLEEPKYSKHALERMQSRGISKNVVAKVLTQPDSVISEESCKQVYQKKYIKSENEYLIRVFINICKKPPLIITAYKTSKVDKYEN